MRNVTLAIFLSFAALGCGTLQTHHPSIYDATVIPEVLHPGDTAILTVRTNDHFNIVRAVEGVLREDQRIRFKMKDDGQGADELEDDNLWSLKVEVPFQAAPGVFTMDLTGFGVDGTPVMMKGTTGDRVPLQTSITVTIVLPEQPGA